MDGLRILIFPLRQLVKVADARREVARTEKGQTKLGRGSAAGYAQSLQT